MTTQELIEYQQGLSQSILNSLSNFPYEIAIAGGAPRDWYFQNSANDIDVFICAVSQDKDREILKLELEGSLGVALTEIQHNPNYELKFYGWEYETEEGQKVQLLCHFQSLIDTVREFPINVSRVYWDGEYHFHYTFNFFTNHRYLIIDDATPGHYIHKILEKFGYPYGVNSVRSFVRNLGGRIRSEREGRNPFGIPFGGVEF